MTEEQTNEIRARLDERIPENQVMTRQGGGGRTFNYVSGYYVISRLNSIFGNGGWSYRIMAMDKVHTESTDRGHSVHYIAQVELVVPSISAVYQEVGYGDGSDRNNLGKAYELATKEAVTDALKRAAKNLGMSFGLCLYAKEQENVDYAESKNTSTGRGEAAANKPAARAGSTGGPAKKPSEGVANANGAGNAPAKTATSGEAQDRESIDSLIENTAMVALKLKKATKESLAEYRNTKYGVDSAKKLNLQQAKEFAGYLQSLVN